MNRYGYSNVRDDKNAQVVYSKQRGAWAGLGKSLWWGSSGWWSTNVLHNMERQKDSCIHCICHLLEFWYDAFDITSRAMFVGRKLPTDMFQPITAKPEVGKGHNQGQQPWLPRHQYFRCTKVRAYCFTITYVLVSRSIALLLVSKQIQRIQYNFSRGGTRIPMNWVEHSVKLWYHHFIFWLTDTLTTTLLDADWYKMTMTQGLGLMHAELCPSAAIYSNVLV